VSTQPISFSFSLEDLSDQLPAPGYYHSSIRSARFRRSANGNRMLQILHYLDGVSPHHQLVAEYFVLEGASPQGIRWARWRLVQLYRVCGLEPQEGQPIDGSQLLEARLQVRVEHQQLDGQMRLRITGYRPAWPTDESYGS